MLLRGIALENFKSVKDKINLDDLHGLTTIIGPNRSGKSNVLLALNYLKDLLDGKEIDSEKYTFDQMMDAPVGIEVSFEISSDERREIMDEFNKLGNKISTDKLLDTNFIQNISYRIHLKGKEVVNEIMLIMSKDLTTTTFFERSCDGDTQQITHLNLYDFLRHSGDLNRLGDYLRTTPDNIGAPHTLFYEIGDDVKVFADLIRGFFAKTNYMSAKRKLESFLPSKGTNELKSDGSNTVQILGSLHGNDDPLYSEINNTFENLTGGLNISTRLDDNTTIVTREPSLGNPLNIDASSSGTKDTLALITAISQSAKLVLIEEPEVYLDARSQRELMNAIKDQKEKQFIITTHSTIFATVGENEKVFLLSKPEGCTTVHPITDDNNLKIVRTRLGIRHSDTYDNDAVIFVEGKSDRIAFKIVASALGVSSINYHVAELCGTGNLKNLDMLLPYLEHMETKIYTIIDGDSQSKGLINDLTRSGQMKEGMVKILDGEFEDQFTSHQIINSLNNIYGESVIGNLTEENLDKERGNSKIEDVINRHLEGKTVFSKTKFAEDVARELSRDINKRNEAGEPTSGFEKIVRDALTSCGLLPALPN